MIHVSQVLRSPCRPNSHVSPRSRLGSWLNGINPAPVDNDANDNMYKLGSGGGGNNAMLGGPTAINYTMCWQAVPSSRAGGVNAYQNYILT